MIIREKYLIYSNELYHHGIKGQKWGVRRFQNEDGSLTNKGKARYKDISSKVKAGGKKVSNAVQQDAKRQIKGHRLKLEKMYSEKGFNPEESKRLADKRIKIEKAILIASAVTVAACAAYYAKNKIADKYCDHILKSGTVFNNLDATANPRPGEHLYVNYRKNDTDFFRGRFALGKLRKNIRSGDEGVVYNHALEAVKDVKIPSLNTRQKVFKELFNSDPEFKRVFTKYSYQKDGSSAKKIYKKMWSEFGNKDNKDFNIAKRKYFDKLKSMGYDAIPDSWDTKKHVYGADAPLILLDTSSKSFGEMQISKLRPIDILKAQANSEGYGFVRTVKQALLPMPEHINKFEESSKHLKKYADKSAKNSEYIDAYYKYLKDTMTLDESIKEQLQTDAFKRNGSKAARIGKEILKGGNVETAVKKGTIKANLASIGKNAALSSILTSQYLLMDQGAKTFEKRAINRYLVEHPNTKKTIKELEKMYRNGDL